MAGTWDLQKRYTGAGEMTPKCGGVRATLGITKLR
jgi:hypothetical protein